MNGVVPFRRTSIRRSTRTAASRRWPGSCAAVDRGGGSGAAARADPGRDGAVIAYARGDYIARSAERPLGPAGPRRESSTSVTELTGLDEGFVRRSAAASTLARSCAKCSQRGQVGSVYDSNVTAVSIRSRLRRDQRFQRSVAREASSRRRRRRWSTSSPASWDGRSTAAITP